jgi:hypothetical protein
MASIWLKIALLWICVVWWVIPIIWIFGLPIIFMVIRNGVSANTFKEALNDLKESAHLCCLLSLFVMGKYVGEKEFWDEADRRYDEVEF